MHISVDIFSLLSLSPLLVVGYWWTVTNVLSVPTTTTDLKSKKWSTLGLKILHLTFG